MRTVIAASFRWRKRQLETRQNLLIIPLQEFPEETEMRSVVVKVNRNIPGAVYTENGSTRVDVQPGEYRATLVHGLHKRQRSRHAVIHLGRRNVFVLDDARTLLASGAVVVTDASPPPITQSWERIATLAQRIPTVYHASSCRRHNGVNAFGAVSI